MRLSLACLVLLVGCTRDPTVDRVLQKHRGPVNRKIEAMIAMGARARDRGPVKKDELPGRFGTQMVFERGPDWNAAFIQLEEFRDLLNPDPRLPRLDDYIFWPDAVALMRTGSDAWGRRWRKPEVVRAKLQPVLDLRYLLIVRTQEYVPPKPGTAGRWRGDVLAFDLDRRELLGGVRFELPWTATAEELSRQARAQVIAKVTAAISGKAGG